MRRFERLSDLSAGIRMLPSSSTKSLSHPRTPQQTVTQYATAKPAKNASASLTFGKQKSNIPIPNPESAPPFIHGRPSALLSSGHATKIGHVFLLHHHTCVKYNPNRAASTHFLYSLLAVSYNIFFKSYCISIIIMHNNHSVNQTIFSFKTKI